MDLGRFRSVCLSMKGATEEYPFDEYTAAFKVMGRIFALTDTRIFDAINLKVDPEEGSRLRERFPSVSPGYHMNKKHWITVGMDGSISDALLTAWIKNSYSLVVRKLPKSVKSAKLG